MRKAKLMYLVLFGRLTGHYNSMYPFSNKAPLFKHNSNPLKPLKNIIEILKYSTIKH